MSTSTMPSTASSNSLLTVLRITSIVMALGVLLQAWLGSTGFFQGEPGRIDVHAMVGNFLFLLSIIQAGVAVIAMQRGFPTRTILYLSIATVLLTVAQIGLGYSTRDSVDALAWHLPTGVALMGLTTVNAVLVYQVRSRNA